MQTNNVARKPTAADRRRVAGLRREAAHVDMCALAAKDETTRKAMEARAADLYAQADAIIPRPTFPGR